jgi:EpsI family protein
MGNKRLTRFFILSLCLIITAAIVQFSRNSPKEGRQQVPLSQALGEIKNWQVGKQIPMGQNIKTALDLDDYVFQSYANGNQEVTLYIGYYHSAKKVGAAHSPLVCFQGQGWTLSGLDEGEYRLGNASNLSISYAAMIAERHSERELIVYWFQTNAVASASTLTQKMLMVWDRFHGKGEENAFVRISTPINEASPENARKRIFDFIETFYPVFYSYVVGG